MKALFYASFLLAVLVGSVILLQSIRTDEETAPPIAHEPVVESRAPETVEFDTDSTQEIPAGDLVAMGSELLELWHVPEAADVFERAVEADSTSYASWVKLVECYSDPLLAREDEARTAWRHAGASAPSPKDTFFLAAVRDLYIDSDYNAAIGNFTASGREGTTYPGARYQLATAYFRAGRLDESAGLLEDLLSEDASDGRALSLYIRHAVAGGDLERAADRARVLARLYSEEPYPYVLLAQIELMRGDVESAVEFSNNALLLDPRYVPAILVRANLYVAGNNAEAARVSCEKLLLFEDPLLRSIGYEGIAHVDFLAGQFEAGIDAMDESIRNAMLAGAVRRGLSHASRLVGYLCELGQADAAEAVVERWVTGFGDIPVQLGQVRVHILKGDFAKAHRSIARVHANKDWLIWTRAMTLDLTELTALTQIGEEQHEKALGLLENGSEGRGVRAADASRRAFLRGYALFESGDAEGALGAFRDVHRLFYSPEHPYRGDPVLYVQSLFFQAESELARGEEAAARSHYELFLHYWGSTSWEIKAVVRAREKLTALGPSTEDSPPSPFRE